MDNDKIDYYKKLINYYLNGIRFDLAGKNISAQEYFDKYGINKEAWAKTSGVFNYSGEYLGFILNRAFELGYLTAPDDAILLQVDKDLDTEIAKGTFDKYSGPIAESSADLD